MKKILSFLLAAVLVLALAAPAGAVFAPAGVSRPLRTASPGSLPCGGGEDCPSRAYADVPPADNWAHDGIDYCVANGLLGSVSAEALLFSPQTLTSRAMLAAILYRLEGSPAAAAEASFSDVPDGMWFTDCVRWCAAEGIVSGYGDGRFGPSDNVTREQLASILMRYANRKGYQTPADGDVSVFPDAASVSDWALFSVRWAAGAGILSGRGTEAGTVLLPRGTATRAETASVLYRFLPELELSDRLADPETCTHSFTVSLDRAPACESAGLKTLYCTLCAETRSETSPALGHDDETRTVAATCTEGGYEEVSCKRCGRTFRRNEVSPLGHSTDAAGRCTRCGLTFSLPPERCSTVVYVDGKRIETCFCSGDTVYLRPDRIAAACGGAFSAQGGGPDARCSVTLFGKTVSLRAGSKEADGVQRLSSPVLYDGACWYVPAASFLDLFNCSEFWDRAWNQVFYTVIARNDRIAAGYSVPVLMYHAVNDTVFSGGYSSLFVRPADLDAQIALLLKNGYTFITFEDLNNIENIRKPVMLTFDDGYRDNYTNLFPILKKYNVKATVFMITGYIDGARSLTREQLLEMDASGLVSIQSHTVSHEFLSTRTAAQLETETFQSKLDLARILHKEPFVLCYPTGKYSSLSLQYTEKYYEYGLIMESSCWKTGSRNYTLGRKGVYRGSSAAWLLSTLRSWGG